MLVAILSLMLLPSMTSGFVQVGAVHGISTTATTTSKPTFITTTVMTTTSSTTALTMALTLYGHQGSRSPLVNWGAYELGIPFTMGDLPNNPHPFGQLPCLTDDTNDATLFESGAILLYLQQVASSSPEAKASGTTTKLTPAQQAAILSWVTWANASLDPICFLETPDGKVYDTGLKKPNRRMDRLNELLSQSKFLVDDTIFTVADVAVASYLLYAIQFFPSINLYTRWPHVVRFCQDAASRPNYGKAFGSNVQTFLLQTLSDMTGQGSSSSSSGTSNKLFGMF